MGLINRKFGCIKDPDDKRDFRFKLRHRVADIPERVEFPKRLTWVYDQGNEGSCVGHGMVSAFRNSLLLNNMPDYEPSRQMAYYIARAKYFKSEDNGACIRDAVKAANKYGICPESMWPYLPNNIFTEPSRECYREAEKHQLLKYERIRLDENEIKSAIAAGFGIVFGITVFESFMTPVVSNTGMVPIPYAAKEGSYGGHCMFMAAYNDIEKGYYDILNSWGPKWGDKGRCHLPAEYVMEHSNDLWAIHLTE